jgi:hypothetical protein
MISELHNSKVLETVETEKPIHRLVMLLKSQGLTNRQIEKALKEQGTPLSYVHICNICRQSWFLKGVVKLVHERGETKIDAILDLVMKDAIEVAYREMMNDNNSVKERTQCAFELAKLARGQKITVETINTGDIKSLDEEQKRLEEEISELSGSRLKDLDLTKFQSKS